MNNKYKDLAMVDIVEELLRESKKPIAIQDLFAKVAEIKEFSLDDIEKLTTLYMNITQSGKFVFVGDDKWDLKEGNLDLWSDDGSAFIEVVEDFEDEEEFTKYDPADYDDFIIPDEDSVDEFVDELEDDEDDDLDEETKKELEEEKEYIEVELPLHVSDEDDDIDFDADDFDEDDYEEIMDDYEDMYED